MKTSPPKPQPLSFLRIRRIAAGFEVLVDGARRVALHPSFEDAAILAQMLARRNDTPIEVVDASGRRRWMTRAPSAG